MDPRPDELWFGRSLWTDLLGLLALFTDSPSLVRWLARRRMQSTTTSKPAPSPRPLGVTLRELPPVRR